MQALRTKFKSLSLAARQTWLFALIMIIVFGSLGLFVETAIRHHFKVGDNAELQAIIDQVEKALSQGNANLGQRFEDILIGHHHPLLKVSFAQGELLYLSDPSAKTVLEWSPERQSTDESFTLETADKQYYRLRYHLFETTAGQRFHITVAIAIDYHLSFLSQFNHSLRLILLAAIVMSTILGWVAIRYSLRPLAEIVARVRKLSVSQLNNPLDTRAVPKELAQLCDSLNTMMQRLDLAFGRLADYSSDIAHELRTPVSSLMTQTQVALSASREPEEYREVLYSCMDELQRMSQMIADMLFLAQTDNSQQLPDLEPIQLANEIKDLMEFYQILAEEKQIGLFCHGEATLLANRLMLRRAIANLMTNAIKHSAVGSRIDVEIETRQKKICIHVTNPGELLPGTDELKLFDRFYRSRETENKGTGLGLAIVKSIVQAHGGEVAFNSDGQQIRFSLIFPSR
ncbi:heavy metal sensor histidine kinase [uncultured Methylophaga sp.]|uniref:heavy metal sensor histidine kinase n=1 Tax=uncultured Methylophaga sp. TaxID=285271 RepID=UPI00263401EF|nr:heavy metal sensor histidine kinase [uncultured Methylophaga sp.]